MDLLMLAIVLLIIGSISIVLDRRLQARRTAKTGADGASTDVEASSDSSASWTENVTSKVSGEVKGLRGRFSRGQTGPSVAEQFKSWSESGLKDEKELQDWLGSLSSDEYAALIDKLSAHCSEMGIELAWLTDGQLVSGSDLESTAQRLVVIFLQSAQGAEAEKADVEAFKAYKSYVANPTSKSNREFGRQLFVKLSDGGQVKVSSDYVMTVSAREQDKQISEALAVAAADDSSAFNVAVKAVLAGEETAAEETAAEETPAPKTSTRRRKKAAAAPTETATAGA